MSIRRQHANNGIAAGGRPIRIPRSIDSVRSHLKRHLLEEGKRMQDLADVWGCSKHNVYDLFYRDRPISPKHIELAAQMLGQDEFDTKELRTLFANDARSEAGRP
ncbi:hypothetical protein [Stenotrophomonas geniculata]|jgi:AraC-like DNA-binding protein|uniref:hypothetical protein n=1 Tax=Stenotrophomonas geniculata TaxID=86188 RepID=UPI002E7A6187|nr:hypothetical protein [Stenotrophomonas geniculata]